MADPFYKVTSRPEPKYGIGDLVVYNPSKKFGNGDDRLFQIHDRRYGTCTNIPEKIWWYAGHLLEIKDSNIKWIPKLPLYSTTLTNAEESHIMELGKLLKNLSHEKYPPEFYLVSNSSMSKVYDHIR